MGRAVKLKIRISETIANEYITRNVFDGSIDWPFVPSDAGVHLLPLATCAAMLDDAEFQCDPHGGPEDTPPGVKRAYRALVKQLRIAFAERSPKG